MTQKLRTDTDDQPLSALMEVMAATSAGRDSRSVAQAALERALAGVGMSSGSIWACEQGDLICLARSPNYLEARSALADAAVQRVFETGQPEFRTTPGQPSDDIAAILPLIAGGERRGAIVFGGARGELSRQLLGAIADTIAGALEQARLAERLESQGRRLQAIKRQQDELISIISHDLKNPMASIKGYADLMLRRSARNPDDPNRRGLQIISEQIVRMSGLLDTLLDISRIAGDRLRIEPRRADLAWLTGQTIDELRAGTGRHELTLEGANMACLGMFDMSRIRQVIECVVNNAVVYSPAGSPISVCLQKRGQEAIIAVQDRGIGIPPAECERVFEPFFRASNAMSHPGMGMGLFVAQEILARHAGRIWFESVEGEGSTFYIGLPLDPSLS